MDWSNITTLAAVALGFGLSELSGNLKGRKERRRHLYDLRIDVYVQWMSAAESLMHSWTGPKRPTRSTEVRRLAQRLELLETDAEALRLLREIPETLPLEGTSDYEAMYNLLRCDEWFDWQPFREKMNELTERIRSTRPD